MKKSALTATGLMALAALVVVVGIPSLLSAGGPAPQTSAKKASPDVGEMFKEIKKELAEIRAELADIKSLVSGKPEAASTPDEKAALQLAKDVADAAGVNPNIEKLMGLFDTPFFSLKDNKIIKNREELRKFLSVDLGEDVPLSIDDFQIEIAKSLKMNSKTRKQVDEVAPKGRIIVRMTVSFPDETVTTYLVIRPGEKLKVVGVLYFGE